MRPLSFDFVAGTITSPAPIRWFDRSAYPTYICTAIVGAATAVALPVSGIGVSVDLFAFAVRYALSLLTIGLLLRLLRQYDVACGIGIFVLSGTYGTVCTCLSLALAKTGMPLADDLLSQADATLGFHWLTMLQRIPSAVLVILSWVYASMPLQALAIVLARVSLAGRQEAWRFVNAWSIALLACIAIHPFVPALGNYLHYGIEGGYPGVMVQSSGWISPRVMMDVRAGRVPMIKPEHLQGIIVFPSFHAVASVLLAWGFWPFRPARYAGLIWNTAMMVSALFIGAHYLVDLIAGIVIAVLAILLASRLMLTRDRTNEG